MIEIKNLEKSFGDKKVLNNLTCSVVQGNIYGLLGPNGAGKSTTINLLCNLLDPDAGTVTINGSRVSEQTKYLVGIVPQEISLYKDLTCRENLAFFARLYGLSGSIISERIDKLIDQFNLQEYRNTRVSRLSGGWQRRVNIAVALVHSPSVLILDEPTAGLDIGARHDLWKLITNLKETGITILLTTHQLEEAETLCSRIGIMNRGQLIAEGSMHELRTQFPAKQIAVIETDDEQTLRLKADLFGWKYRNYAGNLTLMLPEPFTLKEIIGKLNGMQLSSISLREVRLEHIYMEVTGELSGIRNPVSGIRPITHDPLRLEMP